MDRDDLESGDRLHKGKSRLQVLLCRKNGSPPHVNGAAALFERFQVNIASGFSGIASEEEAAECNLCEFDVGSVP